MAERLIKLSFILALVVLGDATQLRREMQVLGVLDQVPASESVALAEPDFVWEGQPIAEVVDWGAVFSTPQAFGAASAQL